MGRGGGAGSRIHRGRCRRGCGALRPSLCGDELGRLPFERRFVLVELVDVVVRPFVMPLGIEFVWILLPLVQLRLILIRFDFALQRRVGVVSAQYAIVFATYLLPLLLVAAP